MMLFFRSASFLENDGFLIDLSIFVVFGLVRLFGISSML